MKLTPSTALGNECKALAAELLKRNGIVSPKQKKQQNEKVTEAKASPKFWPYNR